MIFVLPGSVRRENSEKLECDDPLNENVISFIGALPKEFDLHRFVDHDKQFDKAFVEPLKAVIGLVGWNPEPVASLDSFFT